MYCNTRNFIEHHTVGLYSGWSKKYAAKFCTWLRQIFTDYQFFFTDTFCGTMEPITDYVDISWRSAARGRQTRVWWWKQAIIELNV